MAWDHFFMFFRKWLSILRHRILYRLFHDSGSHFCSIFLNFSTIWASFFYPLFDIVFDMVLEWIFDGFCEHFGWFRWSFFVSSLNFTIFLKMAPLWYESSIFMVSTSWFFMIFWYFFRLFSTLIFALIFDRFFDGFWLHFGHKKKRRTPL